MPSDGLIVIAGVKPECEERLRNTLNKIGNDINGKRLANGLREPHIDFPASRTIHFARLALLPDPDRGPDRKRLLLATDYDGAWGKHIRELLSLTSDPDAIWGCCEGFTGTDDFTEFIYRHMIAPQAYYISFPGRTLNQLRRLLKLRSESTAPPANLAPVAISDLTQHALDDLVRLPYTGINVLGMLLRRGPLNTLRAAREVNATLDRIWWVWAFNRLTLNRFPAPARRYSSAPVDTTADCAPASIQDQVASKADWVGPPSEDLVSQNQLTLLTSVRPDGLKKLRAVLDVIELYAQRLAEEGSLAGINTIHTVRWVILDKGKRLLMLSNYDGTWENYIDEFAELILSGLDAIWESWYGFPDLGAQDLVAFKHFLRCHQVPANVFYSAYPSATVPILLDALQSELNRMPQS